MPAPTLDREPDQSIARNTDNDDEPLVALTDPKDLELDSGRMSFLEHLDELRKRLIASAIGIAAGCIVSFIFLSRIFRFVMLPLQQMLPDGGKLIVTEGPEYFMLYLKVGLLGGAFVAAPWVLWQLWLFVAPGLYTHEKKFAIPFVLFASIFFFMGAAFSHYIAFPYTWKFFIDFLDDFVTFMPKVGPAFSLYVKMLLGFGLIFQMPVLVLALARMGVITGSFLLRNFKYATLIIFVLGAVLSPGGDIMSQGLMAGPMMVLYIFSIGIAYVFQKRRKADA